MRQPVSNLYVLVPSGPYRLRNAHATEQPASLALSWLAVGLHAGTGFLHVGTQRFQNARKVRETFLIGTRAASTDNADLETYSEQSPLGAAVVGASEGETRKYTAPNGREISVTIVSAEPYDSVKASKPRAKPMARASRNAKPPKRWTQVKRGVNPFPTMGTTCCGTRIWPTSRRTSAMLSPTIHCSLRWCSPARRSCRARSVCLPAA